MATDSYKHGVYGETGSASSVVDTSQGTTPIYIGTLPIHRINKSKLSSIKYGKTADCIMLLLNSIKEVKNLNLISNDWDAYSLCEAIDVHFMHDSAIAPIVLIAKNSYETNAETSTATVSLTKSGTSHIGYISDSKAVIDDMAITATGTTFENGDVSYEYEGDQIKIVITKSGFTANSVTATYKTVSTELMNVEDFTKCLTFADRVENVTNKVPNILCAPQYSENPQYHELMIQKAIDKVDGKWEVICATDIGSVDGIESAIAWAKTNNYNHRLEKVGYPIFGYEGKEYHYSTLWTASSQRIDSENGDTPNESASNKNIFVDTIFGNNELSEGESRDPMYISEQEANKLNANGISTAIIAKGKIRLWGTHMGNYNFEKLSEIAVEDRFDVAVRMSGYIKNYLQYNYLDEVDQTINRKDVDSIINSVQMWLDSLVNDNKLLYAVVEFDEDSDIVNGDIAFNIHVTYPCLAKSITFKVLYTDKGLSVFTTPEGGAE